MPHTNRGKQNNFILAEQARSVRRGCSLCIILALATRLSTFAIGPKILMAIRADFQCSNWELASSLHCQLFIEPLREVVCPFPSPIKPSISRRTVMWPGSKPGYLSFTLHTVHLHMSRSIPPTWPRHFPTFVEWARENCDCHCDCGGDFVLMRR